MKPKLKLIPGGRVDKPGECRVPPRLLMHVTTAPMPQKEFHVVPKKVKTS